MSYDQSLRRSAANPPQAFRRIGKDATPSRISEPTFIAIITRMGLGERITDILDSPEMPTLSELHNDLNSAHMERRRAMYDAARQTQGDYLFDKYWETVERDAVETPLGVVDGSHVSDLRRKMEGYKHLAAKLKPKEYGEQKQEMTVNNNSFVIQAPVPLKSVEEWNEQVEKIQAPEETP